MLCWCLRFYDCVCFVSKSCSCVILWGFILCCRHDVHWFSVVCLSGDEFGELFRWCMVHEAGKAIWMRGGACATELHLMGVCFCWSGWCG